MYNFRYHLVTIVSIFAALVIGLLMGVALTGSDLVRDASSNLARSLTEEFDTLNNENKKLNSDLQNETAFNDELISGWGTDRLDGRTVLILERSTAPNTVLSSTLSNIVTSSGGIPVVVSISDDGLNLDDSARIESLKNIVPEVNGEKYSTTIAKALVEEWSYITRGTDNSLTKLFSDNYRLTNYLISVKAISVDVNYESKMSALSKIDTSSMPSASAQYKVYSQAQQNGVPYGVNALINTAFYTPTGATIPQIDLDALAITSAFEDKARAGDLAYLKVTNKELITNISLDDNAIELINGAAALKLAANTSYFSLFVASGDHKALFGNIASNENIAYVYSPYSTKGRYNIVAALSGATIGNYGLDDTGLESFAAAPTDPHGNQAFVEN